MVGVLLTPGADYGFDPVKDGEPAGGGGWGCRGQGSVWARFVDAPLRSRHPRVAEPLKPAGLMFEKDAWPDGTRRPRDGCERAPGVRWWLATLGVGSRI